MTTELLPPDDADAELSPVEALMAAAIATPAPLRLDATNAVHFDMMTRLAQLEEALLARDPLMKVHLGAIHKLWTQNEELVHLLSDEEIGKIVAAQQAHTQTSLISELTAKAGATKAAARASKTTLADL